MLFRNLDQQLFIFNLSAQIWINTYGKMYSEAETGTYKQSGIDGTLRGIEVLNTFSEIKNILINIE